MHSVMASDSFQHLQNLIGSLLAALYSAKETHLQLRTQGRRRHCFPPVTISRWQWNNWNLYTANEKDPTDGWIIEGEEKDWMDNMHFMERVVCQSPLTRWYVSPYSLDLRQFRTGMLNWVKGQNLLGGWYQAGVFAFSQQTVVGHVSTLARDNGWWSVNTSKHRLCACRNRFVFYT